MPSSNEFVGQVICNEIKRCQNYGPDTNLVAQAKRTADKPLISSGVKPATIEKYTTPEGKEGLRISAVPDRDPLETDPRYAQAFSEAEAKTSKELKRLGVKRQMGYCHTYWKIKKLILRRDHNIDWKTPQELNPYKRFD